jgi:hypothetical protein
MWCTARLRRFNDQDAARSRWLTLTLGGRRPAVCFEESGQLALAASRADRRSDRNTPIPRRLQSQQCSWLVISETCARGSVRITV